MPFGTFSRVVYLDIIKNDLFVFQTFFAKCLLFYAFDVMVLIREA